MKTFTSLLPYVVKKTGEGRVGCRSQEWRIFFCSYLQEYNKRDLYNKISLNKSCVACNLCPSSLLCPRTTGRNWRPCLTSCIVNTKKIVNNWKVSGNHTGFEESTKVFSEFSKSSSVLNLGTGELHKGFFAESIGDTKEFITKSTNNGSDRLSTRETLTSSGQKSNKRPQKAVKLHRKKKVSEENKQVSSKGMEGSSKMQLLLLVYWRTCPCNSAIRSQNIKQSLFCWRVPSTIVWKNACRR